MNATTPELSRQIERVATQYLEQRYSGPGNPMGAQFLRIDDMVASKVPFVPQNEMMNGVHNLEDPALLPEVLAFYAATEQPCWVHVAPYAPTQLTDALCGSGFRPDRHASVMCATPVPEPKTLDIDVREVGRADLDEFLDTINIGFDSPPSTLAILRRNQSFWCDIADWHLFLAQVGGAPAGAAVLSIHEGIGYLAAGSALPSFRGRGVHAALIGARLNRARARGCTTICGAAAWGSQSQRNQQRAGLAIAHVKTIWTNRAIEKG